MATLPLLTRTIDDDFVSTWYEIRAKAIDNILNATVLTAALKRNGCFVSQDGGEYITRTVRYALPATQRVAKGSVLKQTVVKLKTMARWDWKWFLVDVNRTLIDDAKNAGQFQISDYVSDRLEAARDAIVQDLETYMFQWGAYYDPTTPAQINGLYDCVPPATAVSAVGAGSASDSQSAGTSNGNIDRTNDWWKNWVAYDNATADAAAFIAGPTNEPYAVNLLPDMRHMFNTITDNMESPDLILTDQSIYEAYEDEASDKSQIVLSGLTKAIVDLGFPAYTFNGATMSWSKKLAGTLRVFMLNTSHLEFVYDASVWFDMTDWKETANQLERVAYIACMSPGLITAQPRRHGHMLYAS